RAFPKPRKTTGPGLPGSMIKPLIRSIGTSAFCWQQDTRRDFGSRFFAVMPSPAISLRQFASSARQNAKPPARMPLTSLKHSSISEPILCRSGQSKSFDCQPETHSVNHERRGLFVALTADEIEGRRRSLVNFHSFRRWFITKAEQADQPESLIASVVGHKRQGMTLGVYSAGPAKEQARRCVEAVQLPDLSKANADKLTRRT